MDAYVAGGADLGDDSVGDGRAGYIVEVAGIWLWFVAGPDGEETGGGGAGGGDVEGRRGGVSGHVVSASDFEFEGGVGLPDTEMPANWLLMVAAPGRASRSRPGTSGVKVLPAGW